METGQEWTIPLFRYLADAKDCVDSGAKLIHLHPRDNKGNETLDPSIVNEVVAKVQAACGVPVGVTTQEDIEPDVQQRLHLIRGWTQPNFASVNVCEAGSFEVMKELIEMGIGIEAGVWTPEDAEKLCASEMAVQVTRILVEPGAAQVGESEDSALSMVADIHRILDTYKVFVPRLQHGDGLITWALLKDAIDRGLDTRIGLEDTLYGPDGEFVEGNKSLVQAAFNLGLGRM
ncbi:3-keto-5-aminohexanoate cleavage protein [Halobacillus rhizosphaerae]|uniref:3-keto-5-aminohexanoate cleavage protein n=1 Tax=Halobacillus rhizosphaerae TaxID=3064889 RepID=UPI00398B3672